MAMATPPAAIPRSETQARSHGLLQFAAAAAVGVAALAALAAVAIVAGLLGAILAGGALLLRALRGQRRDGALEARRTAEGWVVEAAPNAR